MAQVESIQARRLTKQQAAPRVGSTISPHRQEVAEYLTPQRLSAVIAAADQGDPEQLFTLFEEMEEKELHYASVLGTRKLGVAGCERSVEAPDDSADAKRIATAVEQHIVAPPHFETLIIDLMDGLAKGIALVETLWSRTPELWLPERYEFRPQRYFVFDEDTMTTPLLRDDSGGPGIPLDPYKWIIHTPRLRSGVPVRTGLARTVAVAYAAKRWVVADWLAFLDVYGIPIRVGKYPAHLADKKAALLSAMMRIGSDAAAVIPQEMQVDIIEASGGATGGGQTLFEQAATYWDKQVSKVVIGATMTSDDGASLAQSKTHERVRFDLLAADARAIAATINRDLIEPFVKLNFGEQKAYPKLLIHADELEDTKTLMDTVKTYVNLGGRVQASEVRDRLGLAEPEDGAELLVPESLVKAQDAPEPDEGPVDDTPGSAGVDVDDDAAPDEGDDVEVDERELNAERPPPQLEPYDATDEIAARELAGWRSLERDNVGRLLLEVQRASSYDEARAKLAELARDEGEVLDVGALVVSLARSMLKLRGVGDATDEVKP